MNIVVIVTDSLRTDFIGCYGSKVKTPNIDRLAKQGVKFTQAYSENLPTLPTRRSWWTGKYHFHEAGWQPFTPNDYLLAEVLWDKGYKSALITDTYHMHKPVYNCGRGFDTTVFVRGQEYDPWIVDAENIMPVEKSPFHRLKGGEGRESDTIWRKNFDQYLKNRSVLKKEGDYCVARVAKEAIIWLEQAASTQKDNLFLWVDMFDPHEPWDPPEPYRSRYKDPKYNGPDLIDPVPGDVRGYMTKEEIENTKNLYAGEVTFVDKYVGKIIDKLEELGLSDNTLIIYTSDHGVPFSEHGYIRKAKPRNFQNLVHIPWIIRHPESKWVGQECDALVQTVDLMPTLLDLVGIKFNDFRLGGKSLMPLLEGKTNNIRDFAIGGHYSHEWYVRTHRWTYLLPLNKEKKPELYDRSQDPEEQENVIADNLDVANELELNLYRFVQFL